jgi:hypothetical protein
MRTYVRTIMLCTVYYVMSQLSDWNVRTYQVRTIMLCHNLRTMSGTYVTLVPWYHPWNPQARTTTETVVKEAMQALVRVRPTCLRARACEDCGGDPRCRHRCRVGTVVYRHVFYADNRPLSFPVAPECVYFKSFLIMLYLYHGTRVWYVRTTSVRAKVL